MENLAKPSSGFFRHAGMKKFLLAILTIAALSGAVLVTHSSPAAAGTYGGGGGGGGDRCGEYYC
jgi:hypothetical protein